VRRLTENMQGRIWVESVFQKGSTFFLQLPRVDTQQAEHLKAEQQARAQQAAQQAALNPAPVATLAQEAPPAPIVTADGTVSAPLMPVTLAYNPSALPTPPVRAPVPTGARPATTVPRGQSLTREQINERVKQLEALAQEQRGQSTR